MRPANKFHLHILLTLLAMPVLIAVPFLFETEEMREFYVSEGGPVQILSAAGYLIVMVTLVREMSWRALSERWYLVAIPLAMCLREMDFHAHLTTYSITKTSLYTSAEVPLAEKLFGVSIFAVLGAAFFLLAKNHLRAFREGLRSGDPTALGIAAAIACMVVSKALDGAASNLDFLGLDIELTYLSVAVEEVLELGVPMFLAIAAFATFPAGLAGHRPAGAAGPYR